MDGDAAGARVRVADHTGRADRRGPGQRVGGVVAAADEGPFQAGVPHRALQTGVQAGDVVRVVVRRIGHRHRGVEDDPADTGPDGGLGQHRRGVVAAGREIEEQRLGPGQQRFEGVRAGEVGSDGLGLGGQPGAGRIAGQRADRGAPREEPVDKYAADVACCAGHNDHGGSFLRLHGMTTVFRLLGE